MALLLAMYQKFRLIREKNQAVLDLTRLTGKISRIEKNIKNTQERYTSMIAGIDQQAKMMVSNSKVYFNSLFNVGTYMTAGGLNPAYGGGMNPAALGFAAQMAAQGCQVKGANGTPTPVTLDSNEFNTYYQQYMSNGYSLYKRDNSGGFLDGITKDKAALFQQAIAAASQYQQQQQFNAQQCAQNYENNVSVWAEARKAELECEQDAAVEPLSYEQTMLQSEKEYLEQKIERIKAEYDSYSQLVKDETQNTVPKFGLG